MKNTDNSESNDNPEMTSENQKTPSSPIKRGAEKATRKSQRKVSRNEKPVATTARRRTNPAVWLLLLINSIIGALLVAAAFYGWLQWQSMQEQQTEREAQFRADVEASLSQKINAITAQSQKSIGVIQSQIQKDAADTSAALSQFSDKLKAFQEQKGPDWDMLELRYLINMAESKVRLENDALAAIEILSSLDAQISATDNLNLLPLREAIAFDMQQLKVANLSSPVDSAIKLTALIGMSDELSFLQPREVYESETREISGDISEWWPNLKIFAARIRDDFFNFERLDEPFEPYLNRQEKETIRSSLKYSLLTARHALLNREQVLYEQALQQSLALTQKFDANGPQFAVFSGDLDGLLKTPFPTKVDIKLKSKQLIAGTPKAVIESAPAETNSPTVEESL